MQALEREKYLSILMKDRQSDPGLTRKAGILGSLRFEVPLRSNILSQSATTIQVLC
jgi:hypothetical protein